jgi:beta-lactamase class A
MNEEPKLNQDSDNREVTKPKNRSKRTRSIVNNLKKENEILRQENEYLRDYIEKKIQGKTTESLKTLVFLPKEKYKDGSFRIPRYYVFVITTMSIVSIFTSLGIVLVKNLNNQQSQIPETEKISPSPSPSSSPQITINPSLPDLTSLSPLPQPELKNNETLYTFAAYSQFNENSELQSIVDNIIDYSQKKKFPINKLSITLIDVNTHEIAGYQQEKLVYPASVVKLFWLVILSEKYYRGYNLNISNPDIEKMIKRSDNEATSRVVDAITETKSGSKLKDKEYKEWLNKRYSLNEFFQRSGYGDINISQKTFPIPSEKLYEPQGRDLQIRGNPNKPNRNKISTFQSAKLMYEIFTNRSISPEYSQYLQQRLLWDLTSPEWRNLDPNAGHFNPIRTFFGERLPTNIYFASKAGWTKNTRQEVAYISTKDRKISYILAMFGEDASYAKDGKLFPEISKQVFNKMSNAEAGQ